MSKLISASIDLTKIDKARIKEGKNGQKYYDVLISCNDTPNQFGQDVSIMQGQTKEEREAKATKVYLGNGKTFWSNEATAKPASAPAQPQGEHSASSDDLPF